MIVAISARISTEKSAAFVAWAYGLLRKRLDEQMRLVREDYAPLKDAYEATRSKVASLEATLESERHYLEIYKSAYDSALDAIDRKMPELFGPSPRNLFPFLAPSAQHSGLLPASRALVEWGMARSLAPDRPRAGIAVAALFLVVFVAGSFGQLGAIVLGAVAGLVFCQAAPQAVTGHLTFPVSRRAGAVALIAFVLLLVVPQLLATGLQSQALALFDAFFRSGALVFGGGHVVLPLLQAEVVDPGWVSPGTFLAGYGAAQAVPGPLFTFAAYLGAMVDPSPHGVAGAAIALVAIFLPGVLLVYGTLPYWDAFRSRPMAQAAMRGTNAAVVGILGSALYNPVWTSAIGNPRDFAVAVLAFVLLTVGRVPPWIVVALTVLGGAALTLL